MRTSFTFLFIALFSATVFAGDPPIKWKGDIRVRGELDGRDFLKKTPPNLYTLLRSRLSAEATPIDRVNLFFQIQDSRTFGEEKDALGSFNTISNTKNLDVHQAYLKVDSLLAEGLSLKLGRMEMAYGNERIVGSVGWNNVGRSFDGGVLRYASQKDYVDLFVMNVSETTVPPSVATVGSVSAARDTGQMFSGLYYSGKPMENHQLDIYAMHQLDRLRPSGADNKLSRFTLGALFKGNTNSVLYDAEFAYQTGKTGATNIGAMMFAILLGYNFTDLPLTSVSAGFDYLSGNKDNDKDMKAFDPMYHTGHKFYGFMDYFISIPTNTANRGLQDMYARVVLKPEANTSLAIWGHFFQYAQPLKDVQGIGQEIDIVGQYKYNKNLSFELGLCGFLPGEIMRANFKGADMAIWSYFTTNVWF